MAGRSKKSSKSWKKLVQSAPETSCSYMGRFFGRMEDQIEQSAIDGLEHGLTFCIDKKSGKVLATDPCTGSECAIRPVQCDVGEELYGDFHVHPTGNTGQSMADLMYSFRNKQRVGCVGGTIETTYITKEGDFEVPTTLIKCYGFNVDNKDFTPFYERLKPKLEEANDLSSALVNKVFRDKKSMSNEEWMEYKKVSDAVMDEVKSSGLYSDNCSMITDAFGETRRYRVEDAKPPKKK